MFLSIILFTVCFLLIAKWWKHRNHPPGPWGLPIIGYLPFINPDAPHITFTNLSKKYGPIYSLYLGNVFTIVLTDTKLIRKVLAMEEVTGRAPLHLTHGIMKGYGIICAQGELWKDQRKFLSSSLKHLGIQKFGDKRKNIENIILTEVKDAIENIILKLQNGCYSMDLTELLRHNIGSVINSLVFGLKYERNDETWLWLQNLQEEGVKLIGIAGPLNFIPFLGLIPSFKKTVKYITDGQKRTHQLYQKIIDEKIEEPNKRSNSNILELFLTERENRENIKVGEECYSFTQLHYLLADVFGAGLDTTLATLSWHFLFMAMNTSVQKRIQEELDAITQGRILTLEDCRSLPQLEASVAETQRIRSVIPTGIPHGTVKECDIVGYKVPKGAMIVPLQWAVHMNENNWDKPDIYNIERFLGTDGQFVKPDNYIPFQTGKRMCIGDELARMILLLFVGNILLEFDISCHKDVNLDGITGITLVPEQHQLTFRKRNLVVE